MPSFPTAGFLFKKIFHEIFNISILYEIDDLNKFSKELDRIALEKDFDFDRIRDYYQDLRNNKTELIDSEIADYILTRIMLFLDLYKDVVLYTNVAFIKDESFKPLLTKILLLSLLQETELFISFLKEKGCYQIPEDPFWYLKEWTTNAEYPMDTFLKWLRNKTGESSYNGLSGIIEENIHGGICEDHAESTRRNWQRWRNQGQKVQRNTLNQWFSSEDTRKYIFAFIIASGYHTLISSSDEYKFFSDASKELIYLFNKFISFEAVMDFLIQELKLLNTENNVSGQIKHNPIFSLDIEKGIRDHETAENILTTLINNNSIPKYYRYWLQAKYCIMINSENKRKETLKFYKQAFEAGKYSAGSELLDIIKQYITLACYLDKPEDVKRAYKWAYYYELFNDKYLENEKWFITLQRQQFYSIFPPEFYYHKFPNKNKTSLENRSSTFIHFDDGTETTINDVNEEVKYNNDKMSVLTKCSTRGEYENVKLLLEKGANPNHITKNNTTPLINALLNNHIEIVHLLLEYDLNGSINTKTPRKNISALSVAIDRCSVSLVKKIVDQGADLESEISLDSVSALYYVLQKISFILTPEEKLQSKITAKTRQESAVEALRKNNIYKALSQNLYDHEYENMAKVHTSAIKGLTKEDKKAILTLAGERYDLNDFIQILIILLEAGANINHVHSHANDFTPLLFAAEIGHIDIFKLVYGHAPDPSKLAKDGSSILNQLVDHINLELFMFFIENTSTDIIHKIKNTQTSLGYTPLNILMTKYFHCVLERDEIMKIIQKFMEYSPDITTQCVHKYSPFDIAEGMHDKLMIDILKRRYAVIF